MRRRGARRYGLAAAAAALCAVTALPGRAAAETGPYAFQRDARTVEGAGSTGAAKALDAGATYRGSLGPQGGTTGKRYYRLDLDARTNAYVSVTAVPAADSNVAVADGMRVSLQDGDGTDCSSTQATFGTSESPRPLVAAAQRLIAPGADGCQAAGPYYVVVERLTTDSGSTQDDWGLELHYSSEPALRKDVPATPPGDWSSVAPQPPAGDPVARRGGKGFGAARGLGVGVWQDGLAPGGTLFYRVPVDWGQQLFVGAEIGSSDGSDSGGGFVSSALVVSLYNPARAFVDETEASFDGRQQSAAFEPLPPVSYQNRYAAGERIAAMRFAGWYYIAVNLSPEVARRVGAGPYAVTLRVSVDGSPKPAPPYAGRTEPLGEFTVTHQDERAAESGATPGTRPVRGDTMRLVAAAAFGLGVLLVLVLAVWTVVARRRVPSAPDAGTATGTGTGAAEGGGGPRFGGPVRYGLPVEYDRSAGGEYGTGYGPDQGHGDGPYASGHGDGGAYGEPGAYGDFEAYGDSGAYGESGAYGGDGAYGGGAEYGSVGGYVDGGGAYRGRSGHGSSGQYRGPGG